MKSSIISILFSSLSFISLNSIEISLSIIELSRLLLLLFLISIIESSFLLSFSIIILLLLCLLLIVLLLSIIKLLLFCIDLYLFAKYSRFFTFKACLLFFWYSIFWDKYNFCKYLYSLLFSSDVVIIVILFPSLLNAIKVGLISSYVIFFICKIL